MEAVSIEMPSTATPPSSSADTVPLLAAEQHAHAHQLSPPPAHHHHPHQHAHGHGHGHAPHPHPHPHPPSHQHGPHCSHGASPAPPPVIEFTSPQEELFHCARMDDLPRFQALVNEHGAAMVLQRDPQGHTVAHWVAQRGSAALLEYVHELGAPLNLPSEDAVQLHPIHWACSSGNLAALRTLVALGVDINTADDAKHRTPLLLAAQNGFPLLVMFCVKHGADINLVDIDHDSAIHWAAYKGATEIVSVFQYLGLSTDQPDRYGQTPLHLAAMRGALATVQYLVEELDSELLALDKQGRTPQQLAAKKGFARVAQYLENRTQRRRWNVFAWWEASRAPFYFVLANIVLSLVAYVQVLIPHMPELRGLYVVHLAWNTVTWLLFVVATRTRAGGIAQNAQYQDEYARVTEELVQGKTGSSADRQSSLQLRANLERPLCHSCHIQRPLRAKHCRVCKTCVHTFDHHCPFIDNCVGRDNYVPFLLFVAALALDLVVLEYIFYRQWSARGAVWWLVLAMIYITALLLPVLHLLGFHCYLTAANLTTNEVVNSHRYQYLRSEDGAYQNPFDRGLVRNIMHRCLPAIMHGGNGEDDDAHHHRLDVKRANEHERQRLQQHHEKGSGDDAFESPV